MVPKCPYCGALKEMAWNAGYLVWVCPQERSGLGNHPQQITTNTTDSAYAERRLKSK